MKINKSILHTSSCKNYKPTTSNKYKTKMINNRRSSLN